jgi:hypothetical protein
VKDFNERNIFITGKLLKQGYRYYKLRKYYTKFYNRNFDLISKLNSDLKTLLRQGIIQPDVPFPYAFSLYGPNIQSFICFLLVPYQFLIIYS